MNKHAMAATLLFARTLTYNNKQQSISLGTFIFEFLKNLVGTVNIMTFTHPFDIHYNNGMYTVSNKKLSMQAVFHYGPGMSGYNENDTISHDLFNVQSYIADLSRTTQPPYYSIVKGPLWDLLGDYSVDLTNPLSPKISLSINFAKLKFSCLRMINDRYTMSVELHDEFTLDQSRFESFLFDYKGRAYIPPFFLKEFIPMVNNDSLFIDFSGTRLSTDTFYSEIQYDYLGAVVKDTLPVSLTQQMMNQFVYFGNYGNRNKVHGNYSAHSKIFVGTTNIIQSFFKGVYATDNLDTAQFYCDSAYTELFGMLYFDTPTEDSLYFVSERYGYDFTLPGGMYLFE